jgi:hypothetical protein
LIVEKKFTSTYRQAGRRFGEIISYLNKPPINAKVDDEGSLDILKEVINEDC